MALLGMITTDTTDPRRLSAWWAERLGGQIVLDSDGYFSIVALPGSPLRLGFQYVEQPTGGKNRIHLDFGWSEGETREAGIAAWVEAGATHLGQRGESGFHWDTFADPDGNEFCIAASH